MTYRKTFFILAVILVLITSYGLSSLVSITFAPETISSSSKYIFVQKKVSDSIPFQDYVVQTETEEEKRGFEKENTLSNDNFFDVPFFSQFDDITSPHWKKIGCGIVSLNMIIEYYKPGKISVDNLLNEGINSGAYIKNAGWSHRGLALLGENHGLEGFTYDFSSNSMDSAFEKFKTALKKGPVIASVHYTFDPTNPIPHLVVINGIDGNTLNYTDPAEGKGKISANAFKKAWKKRYIQVLPVT